MNKNVFCSRKGGATINGKFHPHPTTSDILAKQIQDQADKLEIRNQKRKVN